MIWQQIFMFLLYLWQGERAFVGSFCDLFPCSFFLFIPADFPIISSFTCTVSLFGGNIVSCIHIGFKPSLLRLYDIPRSLSRKSLIKSMKQHPPIRPFLFFFFIFCNIYCSVFHYILIIFSSCFQISIYNSKKSIGRCLLLRKY